MSIPVYILSVSNDSTPAEKVASLFDHEYFITNIVRINIPPNLSVSVAMTPEEAANSYRIMWALNDAKAKYNSSYVLIIQETSTTNVDPERLSEIVESITTTRRFDLCYLSNWLDRCDLYSEFEHLTVYNPDGSTYQLPTLTTRTKRPNGTQALLFSPHGRDILLGDAYMSNNELFTPVNTPLSIQLRKNIESGNINAITTQPNVINYDVTYADNNSDYLKLSECTTEHCTQSESNSLSIFWFIVIIIIIVILAWLATQM